MESKMTIRDEGGWKRLFVANKTGHAVTQSNFLVDNDE